MAQINDFEFGIAVKLAANKCLAADVSEFMALNTENTVVDPNVEKRVIRKLKFDEWKDVRRISAKTLRVALIALVSAVSLFFGATMMIQPVRAAFFGAIVTWYEEYIDVRFTNDSGKENNSDLVPVTLTYIPDGWSIIDETLSIGVYSCDFINSDNGYIGFMQNKEYESGVWIDNNGIQGEELVYLKNDTIEANLFIYENGDYALVWKDKYMFCLVTENVELEELIMIAEGIE